MTESKQNLGGLGKLKIKRPSCDMLAIKRCLLVSTFTTFSNSYGISHRYSNIHNIIKRGKRDSPKSNINMLGPHECFLDAS